HAAAFAFELLSRLANQTTTELTSSATQGDSIDAWTRLIELAPRLYPRGPDDRAVWEEAGGDVSHLDLSESGRTQWARAIRQLRKGGGGGAITVRRLLERMASDFGNNLELQSLRQRE